jgi:ABC-type dipeptide/oligopeptide/nickel transport system permease subunit
MAATPILDAAASNETNLSRRQRTLWSDALRRFYHNRLAMFGLALVLFFIILAVFADLLAPYRYDQADFSKVLQFPFLDPQHPLGGDEVGRDFLSRLIYGARTSLTVGLAVQLIAFGIGVPLGAVAGYRGGAVDFIVMRIVDIMTAFPGLLFAIFLITLWGGGLEKVILVLGLTSWLGALRLTRAQFLSLREKEFVGAARAIGATQKRIIFRHILPNALTPLLVAVSFGIPAAIFAEASLSFLGIGVNDPLPSWGKMVGVSGAYIRVYWHVGLFPTILIALTMLGFSFVGDGLRDALDPKLMIQ